ncbi:MAG: hypothetical protein ACYCQJ_11355 [Nitrososphaerales archaeon]
MKSKTTNLYFITLAIILITLNGYTLLSALPFTGGSQPFCDAQGCTRVARDFSAYYEAAYRFIFNPSQVYHVGSLPNDYPIAPSPQNFRYSPFFLPLFMVPLTLFSYNTALILFDILQFALLPLIAYLLFEVMLALSDKRADNLTIASFSGVFIFALLQPLVPSLSNLTYWSWSYWRLWEQGEARVLQTFLLVLTFYLVLRNSKFSGLSFVLSSFDPRMSIISLPLIIFFCLRQKNLRMFVVSSLVCFAFLYIPTMLYANLGSQFVGTIFINDFNFYSYELIPIMTIISLAIATCLVEFRKMKARSTKERTGPLRKTLGSVGDHNH